MMTMKESVFARVPKTAVAIGLDIGGTKISAARVTLQDGMTAFEKVPTPERGADFIEAILTLLAPLLSVRDGRPICLGIASAGTINPLTGDIFGSTGNLPALKDIGSLTGTLAEKIGLPVFIENDANAAAYGEVCVGAARGHKNVLMVTLGTGVGAGIVTNGHLIRGAHWSAAEAGHIAIGMTQERLCTCGRWDCWEAFASGTGMAQTARLELKKAVNAHASLVLKGHKLIDDVTTHDVIDAMLAGDEVAQGIMGLWHHHIAVGLGSLLNVLDPELTVVSGGMAKYVDYEKLTQLTQARSMVHDITIVPAQLDNQAGIMGAAILALERVH